jgi:hypothetical protein
MSDTPTPRTNEAQFGTGRVSVDFARQLERELAAANGRIRRLEQAGDALFQQFHHPTLQTHQWTKAKEAKA